MSEPVLVILAAGIGSRYGGMKQIDGIGNHGEPIIEFSIYDAYRAGFKKVVLIIKQEHEELFRKCLTDRIAKKMEVEFVYQSLEDLPAGLTVPAGRTKPWGTTHALWCCRNTVREPFAIINADDFYGRHCYETLYHYLKDEIQDDVYANVGWQCINTLTDNGTVTRAVLKVGEDGCLTHIQEVKEIAKVNGHAEALLDGQKTILPDDTLVSMNFWGFTPKIFAEAEEQMIHYLETNIPVNPEKCECLIPTSVGELMAQNRCRVRVLSSQDDWFGVTYHEDKPYVQKRVAELKAQGIYPEIVWE